MLFAFLLKGVYSEIKLEQQCKNDDKDDNSNRGEFEVNKQRRRKSDEPPSMPQICEHGEDENTTLLNDGSSSPTSSSADESRYLEVNNNENENVADEKLTKEVSISLQGPFLQLGMI